MRFRVDGLPVGKQRPRWGKGRMYTPAKTVEYENRVTEACMKAMKDADMLMFAPDVPLTIKVTAYMPIPKSWSKKKIERAVCGLVPFLNKPDADNILKSVCDGVQGVLVEDDKQFTLCIIEKKYSADPHTDIEVYDKNVCGCI